MVYSQIRNCQFGYASLFDRLWCSVLIWACLSPVELNNWPQRTQTSFLLPFSSSKCSARTWSSSSYTPLKLALHDLQMSRSIFFVGLHFTLTASHWVAFLSTCSLYSSRGRTFDCGWFLSSFPSAALPQLYWTCVLFWFGHEHKTFPTMSWWKCVKLHDMNFTLLSGSQVLRTVCTCKVLHFHLRCNLQREIEL